MGEEVSSLPSTLNSYTLNDYLSVRRPGGSRTSIWPRSGSTSSSTSARAGTSVSLSLAITHHVDVVAARLQYLHDLPEGRDVLSHDVQADDLVVVVGPLGRRGDLLARDGEVRPSQGLGGRPVANGVETDDEVGLVLPGGNDADGQVAE